jgi:hypothetical protein
MKTALVIVCSLLLAWTNIVPAQAPGTSVASATPSCHCGRKTGCCAAKQSLPVSLPVSAAPASSLQNQFSLLAPVIVAWTLPAIASGEVSSPLTSSLTTTGAPLFARNCAWLI